MAHIDNFFEQHHRNTVKCDFGQHNRVVTFSQCLIYSHCQISMYILVYTDKTAISLEKHRKKTPVNYSLKYI